MKILLISALLLPLAACGSSTSDTLNDAANQSDPAAAAVLRNEAAQIDENGADSQMSAPNSAAQQALQEAGNAAVNANGSGSQPSPPDTGAKPHAQGDPVPPPQVAPGK